MAHEKRERALGSQTSHDLKGQERSGAIRGVSARKRKILFAAAISVMATWMGMTSVAPATAYAEDWDEHMLTDDRFPGGVVRFKADGDIVLLKDIQADDHAVYLKVWDHTAGKFKYDYTIGGEGRSREFRSALGGPYDLAENHVFGFQICLVKNGEKLFCDTAFWHNKN